MQDYLKEIYKLEEEDGRATTSAIARADGRAAAVGDGDGEAATALGLVRHERYRGVELTPSGERSRSR